MTWEGLGEQILTLFTVGALSGASFDLSSDCFGKGDFVAICGFSSFESRSRQYEFQKVRFKAFSAIGSRSRRNDVQGF